MEFADIGTALILMGLGYLINEVRKLKKNDTSTPAGGGGGKGEEKAAGGGGGKGEEK